MSGSAVAIVSSGGGAPTANVVSASGDVSLHSGDEVKLIPTTRAVVISKLLPKAGSGIDAIWSSSVTSRGDSSVYEITEHKCFIDLAGMVTSTAHALNDVIGLNATDSSLGKITSGAFGTILSVKAECLETPADGEDGIALVSTTTPLAGNASGSSGIAILSHATWEAGTVVHAVTPPAADTYLHLKQTGATAAPYSAGKFLITFLCRHAVA